MLFLSTEITLSKGIAGAQVPEVVFQGLGQELEYTKFSVVSI